MLTQLVEVIRERGDPVSLRFFGHSLGGAAAYLASMYSALAPQEDLGPIFRQHIATTIRNVGSRITNPAEQWEDIELMTFGEPKSAGERSMPARVAASIGIRLPRIEPAVHHRIVTVEDVAGHVFTDPVPWLPPDIVIFNAMLLKSGARQLARFATHRTIRRLIRNQEPGGWTATDIVLLNWALWSLGYSTTNVNDLTPAQEDAVDAFLATHTIDDLQRRLLAIRQAPPPVVMLQVQIAASRLIIALLPTHHGPADYFYRDGRRYTPSTGFVDSIVGHVSDFTNNYLTGFFHSVAQIGLNAHYMTTAYLPIALSRYDADRARRLAAGEANIDSVLPLARQWASAPAPTARIIEEREPIMPLSWSYARGPIAYQVVAKTLWSTPGRPGPHHEVVRDEIIDLISTSTSPGFATALLRSYPTNGVTPRAEHWSRAPDWVLACQQELQSAVNAYLTEQARDQIETDARISIASRAAAGNATGLEAMRQDARLLENNLTFDEPPLAQPDLPTPRIVDIFTDPFPNGISQMQALPPPPAPPPPPPPPPPPAVGFRRPGSF